ncbi:hypothetical protein BG004_002520 [Podila humilis]|nr:hypothetical protein BG004_002520 [Podila humilis]
MSILKKRKSELKEIAQSLGLSDSGVREDLVVRISQHVAKHGTSDPELRELLLESGYDGSGSASGSRRSSISETTSSRRSGRQSLESKRLASLSSAAEDDLSDTASKVRATRKLAAARNSASDSESDSAEDPLSEHQVHNFLEQVHDDLEGAKELAHSLEHTLQQKYRSGKDTLRRASKDFTSTVTDTIDGIVGAVNGDKEVESRHGHRRSSHHRHGTNHNMSWCTALKRRFGCSSEAGACSVSACWKDCLKKLHHVGSTSSGFVWITFLLELSVFMSSARSQYNHEGHSGWASCLGFFTNWSTFLTPFFAFYGALFLLPTLLSQLFNVDRAYKRHDRHVNSGDHHYTGLLARKTTSGLFYFVFKFALTYLISQAVSHSHHGGLFGVAKGAAEAVAGHHHLWQGCEHLAEIFRYVPASLSAATSGVGTILALAENVVDRRR